MAVRSLLQLPTKTVPRNFSLTHLQDTVTSNIRILHPERVAAKKQRIIEAGKDLLKFVVDFDQTLTRYSLSTGERGWSSHGAVEKAACMSEQYRQDSAALFQKYFPLERSSELTREQKLPHMEQWWDQAHELLLAQKLERSSIDEIAKNAQIQLREGTSEFFSMCNDKGIPLRIFSAGLGDVIEAIIRHQAVWHPNMSLFSNMMKFDESGHLVGFKGSNIHGLNKTEASLRAILGPDEVHEERRHVILMGDNMGDLAMADPANYETVLTIGFLCHDVEEALPSFMENYDIVVIGDGSFDVVNEILKQV